MNISEMSCFLAELEAGTEEREIYVKNAHDGLLYEIFDIETDREGNVIIHAVCD